MAYFLVNRLNPADKNHTLHSPDPDAERVPDAPQCRLAKLSAATIRDPMIVRRILCVRNQMTPPAMMAGRRTKS
jgi:hypothetical protein